MNALRFDFCYQIIKTIAVEARSEVRSRCNAVGTSSAEVSLVSFDCRQQAGYRLVVVKLPLLEM